MAAVDERAARQLKLILDHELDLTLRSFDQERNRIYASLGAKGLFFSGTRLVQMVKVMESAAFGFLSKSLAFALSKSNEPASFGLVQTATRQLYEAFSEMLPKIVWHPTGLSNVRGAASQSAYDATEKLLEQVWGDLHAKLAIAEFDFDGTAAPAPEPATPDGHSNLLLPTAPIIALVPDGYVTLHSIAGELEALALDEPLVAGGAALPVAAGEHDPLWVWRVQQQRAVSLMLQKCICQDPGMPQLEIWTRHGPGNPLEQIAPMSLALTRSLDWQGTLRTGQLIVLSDPVLKPMDRWPLYVRKEHWLKAKPVLLKRLAPTHFGKPRLPDGQLAAWWKGLDRSQRIMPQRQLEALAKSAFPNHQVARQRIRELAVKRPAGRPSLRGKRPAQTRRK